MNFTIDVTNRVAVPINPPEIICGNNNYTIDFIFDSEWEAYGIKTAIFSYKRNGKKRFVEVVFERNQCRMPILSGIDEVSVGVYVGNLQTTTPAKLVCKKSALCDFTRYEEPPSDVYSQFLQIVNDNYTVATVTEIKNIVEKMKKELPPQAQIIATIRGGSLVCRNERGEIVKGEQDGNVFKFIAPEYGVYTLSGVYGELVQEKVVNVTSVQQYFETLDFYADNFADNDWQTIIEVIQKGVVPDTWNAGDTKNFSESMKVRIIGKNHDTYTDGSKAPFTFMITEDTTGLNGKTNTYASNAEGWKLCTMRRETIPNVFIPRLPDYAQNALRSVKKYTSKGGKNSEIIVTDDTAFLLSEYEMFGTNYSSFAGEGTQYEYYQNGNAPTKGMLLRSPYHDDTKSYAYVNNDCLVDYTDNDTSTSYYPAFCF